MEISQVRMSSVCCVCDVRLKVMGMGIKGIWICIISDVFDDCGDWRKLQ